MTREVAAPTKSFRAAWLSAVLLLLSEPAAALVSESGAPARAWWAAADLALERGDCARALEIASDFDAPPAARGALPDPTGRWEHHARAALLHGECISARTLIERAVADGQAQGYALLGEMHELGRCAPRSLSKAATNYGEAVRRGYVLAAANLGYLVLHGLGVPADTAWARHLFKLVALDLAMLPPNMRRPSLLFVLLNREIPEELEDALQWARDLEESPPERLYQLALRLKNGKGMPRHPSLARRWLERASGKGLLEADHTLALWRLAAPERWYEVNSAFITLFSLSRKGHVPALITYAEQLAEGRYVVPNHTDAYTVLLIAEKAGADVDGLAGRLVRRLTPEQRHFARVAAEVDAVPFFEMRPEWGLVKIFRESAPGPDGMVRPNRD